MAFVYPSSDLDRPAALMNVLGSFWTITYRAQDQLTAYTRATAQMALQAQLNTLELVASLSRFTVPIWHTENWYMLTLLQSQLNTAATSLAQFNGQYLYDGTQQFDVPPASSLFAFPLPPDLAGATKVMNQITNPTLVLTDSLDYTLDTANGAIVFRENPFTNPLWASRPIWSNGQIVDQELVMWVFRGRFDYATIYQQFGYVLGLQLRSSTGYRELVNAVFDALVAGSTGGRIEHALSAITGIPLVQDAQEIVQVVTNDNEGLLIVTDQHVYRYQGCPTVPLVAVGDVVTAGQSLVDALQIFEFNQGIVPAELRALAMGRGFLATCFYGDLVFENKEVPLEVDLDHPSGYTFVRFGLGGFPLDVRHFFEEMQERGIQQLQQPSNPCQPGRRVGTLAHLLDARVNRVGEPGPQDLPKTINPLAFLVQNVLRNNAFLVQLKMCGMGRNSLGLYNAHYLRRILPPHTAMILLIELATNQESITPEDNVSETLGQFTALNILTDTTGVEQVQEYLGVRMISGTCQ